MKRLGFWGMTTTVDLHLHEGTPRNPFLIPKAVFLVSGFKALGLWGFRA